MAPLSGGLAAARCTLAVMGIRRLVLLAIIPLTGGCSTTNEPPGPIAFGSAVNEVTLEVEKPTTSFLLSDEVAWSASLHAPVEGTKVNIIITDSDGGELFGYEQFITDPSATKLINRMPLGRFLPDPGSYVMRYVTLTGEVIAEGAFELTR